MASKLKSASMRNLTLTEKLTVGGGAVAYSSFKLKFQMLGSRVGPKRERYSALFEKDPEKTWMVPDGLMVKGLTIEPVAVDNPDSDPELHLNVLKNLPQKIISEIPGTDCPCGEIAFVVHRTKDDQANGACYPAGKYMTGAPDAEDVRFQVDKGTVYTEPATQNLPHDSFLYFQNFIVNLEGGCDATVRSLGDDPPWVDIKYRRPIPARRYTLQPGCPLTFVDASRTLFRHLPDQVNVPECSVYIDMSKNALVSDGTWGIALGIVGESSMHDQAGGDEWPQLILSVIVHTEQIRS